MKKTLYFFFLLVGLFAFAQSGPNPFSENNSENTFSHDLNKEKVDAAKSAGDCDNDGIPNESDPSPGCDSGGGNPSDPVPIDNYIPLLIIIAVGIMVYHTSQRKNISAEKEPNH